MVKLSANGIELIRIEKVVPIDEEGIERVYRYSVRSNGWILKTHKWRQVNHDLESFRCWNTNAWKRYARLKNDMPVEKCANSWASKMIERNGYSRV